MEQEIPEHFIYLKENDLKQADAVAYCLPDKDSELKQYPFKFPELEPTDVRIKILYTGLCQSDVLHGRQLWHSNSTFPLVPGHEVIGIVTLVGDQVKDHKVGDRVGCNPQRDFCGKCEHCLKGNNQLCIDGTFLYDPYFGGYATHIQLPSKLAFKIPPELPSKEAPPLLCAGLTVFAPMKRYAKAGQTCAVIGIGGLGHLAVQYANKLGLIVTAFTTSFNREKEFRQLGASALSHSTDLKSLEKERGKYDIVVNALFVSDQKVFQAQQYLTKAGGHYIQVGNPPKDVFFEFDHNWIVQNEISIHGSLIGSVQETNDMLKFSGDHKVWPIIEEFSFEDFPKAYNHLEKGHPHFRCVVNVTDWAKKNGFDK